MTRIPILLFLFPAVVLLHGCGEKRPVPYDASVVLSADSLITPEKMALILSDIHLADAALTNDRNRGIATSGKARFLYEGIWRKYGISAVLYEKNLKYYLANPEAYVKVYDRVIAILEQKEPGKSQASPR